MNLNASQTPQTPQRETRHKPAKAASGAGAEEGDIKGTNGTTGARAHKGATKGPGLKRLTKASNASAGNPPETSQTR
jgi:hypothetical protein